MDLLGLWCTKVPDVTQSGSALPPKQETAELQIFHGGFHGQFWTENSDPKSTPNRPQIDPKSTPNRPRIDPESTPNRPQIDPKTTPQNDPKSTPQNIHGAAKAGFPHGGSCWARPGGRGREGGRNKTTNCS